MGGDEGAFCATSAGVSKPKVNAALLDKSRTGLNSKAPGWRCYPYFMRHFLRAAIAVWLLATPPAKPADITKQPSQERTLRLFHLHTGEHLNLIYWREQSYFPEALVKLDRFLRDSLTGTVHHFDPRLFDLLTDLTLAVGAPDGEIQVICGYRSPTTNEFLRTHTTGVAKNSLHMQGEAIDIRLPGVKLLNFRNAALGLARGGVGFYPGSNFIHVDVGPFRRW